MADDMRPNLGAYQHANEHVFRQPPMHTPNLDALAAKSLLFERAYDAQSLCAPSRTAALTSRRPDTTRITDIGHYWREYGGNFTTIPQFFKERGYYTVGAGKVFHGGPSSGNHDCPYSWDVCPYHAPADPYPDDGLHSWKAFSEEELDEKPLRDTANANWLINRLRGIVKTEAPPFFFAYGVYKPHTPFFFPARFLDYYPEDVIELPSNPYCPQKMPNKAWSSPPMIRQFKDCFPETLGIPDLGEINVTMPDWKTKELRRAYYSAISHADDELGRVLNDIKELGIENDTIVVFWGDHGWNLGDHAEWCKLNLFENTNRVPFMIHIPGVTDQGMHTSNLVEMVDIFPTLVELAGFEPLDRCPVPSNDRELCTEGRSLLPLFEDPMRTDWENTVFWQHPRGGYHDGIVPWQMGYTIRDQNYRYTEYVGIEDVGWKHGQWKPRWDNPVDHEELYDMTLDPQENFNRYEDPEYIVLKQELSEKLHLGWSARN